MVDEFLQGFTVIDVRPPYPQDTRPEVCCVAWHVKGACVGDLPASPAATAAAAVQLCPQEESSVEEALFSLCVGGLSPRGRAVGHLNVRRGLTPPGPTALAVVHESRLQA